MGPRNEPGAHRRLLTSALLLALMAMLGACGGAAENSEGIGAVNATTAPGSTATDDHAAALDRLAEMEAAGMTPEEIEAALAALEAGGAPPPDGAGPIVGVFGDSSALTTALGLDAYGVAHPEVLYVDGGATSIGCGLVPEGARRYRGEVLPLREECRTWVDEWRTGVEATEMDIALVQLGPWEVADTARPGGDEFEHIGQPAFDALLRTQLDEGLDVLVDAGVHVVVLTSPTFDVETADGGTPDPPFPESDPDRVAAWNALLEDAAASRAGDVAVVDLGAYLAGLAPGEDDRLRPDGIHFTAETAEEVAADWLAAEIRAAWDARPR
jgi:hypothetical protein